MRVLSVAEADVDRHDEVIALWRQARAELRTGSDAAAERAERRLRAALGRAEVCTHLVCADGAAVGYVLATDNPFALHDDRELTIEQLYVVPEHRGAGVARALLTAVVRSAESTGRDVIVSHVPSMNREANRFFARLGFSPVVIRRVTTAKALRRRLARDDFAPIETLLTVRRRQRLRRPAATARAS